MSADLTLLRIVRAIEFSNDRRQHRRALAHFDDELQFRFVIEWQQSNDRTTGCEHDYRGHHQ